MSSEVDSQIIADITQYNRLMLCKLNDLCNLGTYNTKTPKKELARRFYHYLQTMDGTSQSSRLVDLSLAFEDGTESGDSIRLLDLMETIRAPRSIGPIEAYVQQLVAQGYPEDTARAYAQQYYAQAAQQQQQQ